MPALRIDHVEVYAFRRRGRRVEFLLLLRSAHRRRLPGIWQPVTGQLRARERPLAAAMRELRVETGLTPRRWWALETAPHWVDPASGAVVVLPRFAAQVPWDDRVRLSQEHSRHQFLPAHLAARRVVWESQALGLEAVRRMVLRGGALARALDVTHLAAARRRRSS